MIEPQLASLNMEARWRCTTTLLGVFWDMKTTSRCDQASRRMVAAGVSQEYLLTLADKRNKFSLAEQNFFEAMAKRDFSIEQMVIFLDAPIVADSFSVKTRQQIMEDVSRSWKSLPASLVAATANRATAVSSLMVLAGVVASSTTYVYGELTYNPAIQETALEPAKLFPSVVSHMLDSAAGKLLGAGLSVALVGVTLKTGKKIMESATAAGKAKSVSLEDVLAQSCPTGSMSGLFSNFSQTRARLAEISIPHRNLLSHLSGAELRVFLQGNDQLRQEMLSARPPSYAQRLACINALDVNLFSRIAQQMVLVGSTWEGPLAHGPATLKESLRLMRQRNSPTDIPAAPRSNSLPA